MNKIFYTAIAVALLWWFFAPQPKADWSGLRAPSGPFQTAAGLPAPWIKGEFTFTPRARYHIKAVVLSKHHYWAGADEDEIAPYDLALGWGPMSEAKVINALKITQGGRWYNYSWGSDLPFDPAGAVRHSANTHIIAADQKILDRIKSLRRFDVVDLQGYLVDVSKPNGWRWHTSLSRDDTGGGSCEVFWVNQFN